MGSLPYLFFTIERSRKRHKTNTPAKTTPSNRGTTQQDNSDSEDDFKLPKIHLPRGPLSKESPIATPDMNGGSPTLTEPTARSGKRSPCPKVTNAPRPIATTGKESPYSKVTNTPIATTGKRSTVTVVNNGKGSSKKKVKTKDKEPVKRNSLTNSVLPPRKRVQSPNKENDVSPAGE